MNMSGMNGSTFLNEDTYLAPDAVRVMLTGERDQKTAVLKEPIQVRLRAS